MEAVNTEKIKEFLDPGDGYGYGYGSGYGYGDGSGYGYGYGSGDGSGYGSGIDELNGLSVHHVDSVQTVFYHIHGNVAKGAILREDLTLEHCFMLKRDKSGRRTFADHVFTGLDEDSETIGINIFSPELREQSFLNRKQEYLRNVESIIGLKRGLLSEVEAADRTAKEITSSEGDYNLTIIDFQSMWEEAVREAVRLCGIFGQLYHVPGAHEVDPESVAIDWGNGVLYDDEAAWADKKDQVARGLLKPEIAVGWRYGMPYETEAQRNKIREKYMPDVLDESGEE